MRRYLSIDILRGVAILLMIQVHFVENLSSPEDGWRWLSNATTVLGSFAAPLFTVVSGMSYGLWVAKQESLGRSDETITAMSLCRGVFLFVLGLVFNVCIWLPEGTWNWDILTLLGTSLLLLTCARRLPAPVLGLLCVLVALFSPVFRLPGIGDYAASWNAGDYEPDFTTHDIVFGFLSNGYFPVFPWILFPIVGYLAGAAVLRPASREHVGRTAWVGVGLLILAGATALLRHILPAFLSRPYCNGFTEFPATTGFLLGMLGFILVALVLLHRGVDLRERVDADGPFLRFLRRYSFFSLTVYVLHHMVILWPLWICGALAGRVDPQTGSVDPTVFYRKAMSAPVAFALALAFIPVCYLLLILLEKHRWFALESLMRWVCEAPFSGKDGQRVVQKPEVAARGPDPRPLAE